MNGTALAGTLRKLPFAVRLGLTLLLLVNLGGFAASGLHVREHHENRDERPGLTLTDLEGAYHGVEAAAPLVTALAGGHPEELAEGERELLLGWLASDRISEDFDNLDLGEAAPAEVLAGACLDCHSRNSDEAIRAEPSLDYWDDVKGLAFSRSIQATDTSILLASTHTHAISLATITLLLSFMVLATGMPSALKSVLILLASFGLALDLGSWWLARSASVFVKLIAVSGATYALATGLMMLLVLVDLWRPLRDGARAG